MEEVINRIIIAMDDLTPDQIRKLKNVLTINLSEKYSGKNEIVKDKNGWEIILKNYLCCKKLENCADGTLQHYQRILRILYSEIGKEVKDITSNDLRFFMASYIERRKISQQYSENIRHILNGFFQWCQDEEIINVNPAKKSRG